MKFGEERTITENDLYIVESDGLFYGPCNQKQAERIALNRLLRWKPAQLHWLNLPEVILGEE